MLEALLNIIGLRSPFGAGLIRPRSFCSAGTAVTTIDNSERKFLVQNALNPTMLERNVHVDSTKLFERRDGQNHKPRTVLVLVSSQRLKQVIFRLL